MTKREKEQVQEEEVQEKQDNLTKKLGNSKSIDTDTYKYTIKNISRRTLKDKYFDKIISACKLETGDIHSYECEGWWIKRHIIDHTGMIKRHMVEERNIEFEFINLSAEKKWQKMKEVIKNIINIITTGFITYIVKNVIIGITAGILMELFLTYVINKIDIPTKEFGKK